MKQFLSLLTLAFFSSICTGQECNIEFEDFEVWDTEWIPYYPGAAEPKVWDAGGWDGVDYYLDIESQFTQQDDTVALETINVIDVLNPGIIEYSFRFGDECGRLSIDFLESFQDSGNVSSIGRFDFMYNGIFMGQDSIADCMQSGSSFDQYKFQLDFSAQSIVLTCKNGDEFVANFETNASTFYGVAFGSNQCAFITEICVNNTPAFFDNDNDTYLSDVDCDDNDPDVNPGAIEIPYNGKDDDCDPMTREDDLDVDNFGIELDCNDEDPLINPAAEEIPNNGIDEDCDGSDLISGTLEIDGESITVFPIPTDRYIHVEGLENLEVEVFDTKGRTIDISFRNGIVDLKYAERGCYILRISLAGQPAKFATTRLVLSH